ncbi:hypothetical protein FACS1894162_2270 [Bacteroidia bacterium]|nr:hypothetical protein FACS1894162_2270 [Bacteroidia bacterium]
MKKASLMIMMSICMVLTSCAQKVVNPNLKGLTGIDASSAFDITLTRGSSESLTIEADEEIKPFVRHKVKNGVLHLWVEKNKLKNTKKLRAYVTVEELSLLKLSGACQISGTGVFPSKECKIDCSGASKINLQIETNNLAIDISGACNLQLRVQAASISLNASGASKVNISTPSAASSYTSCDDESSHFTVQVASALKKVSIDCSGSSNIKLSGSAQLLNIDLSGASKIDAEQFSAKTAKIHTTGASKVKVGKIEDLKGSASGVSDIQYNKSSTVTDLTTSGAAKSRPY